MVKADERALIREATKELLEALVGFERRGAETGEAEEEVAAESIQPDVREVDVPLARGEVGIGLGCGDGGAGEV